MIDDGDLTIDGADLMAQIRAGATDPGTDRRTTGWRPPVAPVPAAATEPSVGGMSRIQAGIVGGIVVLGLTIGGPSASPGRGETPATSRPVHSQHTSVLPMGTTCRM